MRETVRKCARTFSNVVALIDEHPDFVFAGPAAQHYQWIKEHYPALFARIQEKVAAGQFVPVGGMWVESDTNMPGSEAMARQFIAGKRFFLDEFGVEPLEVWLPDSFGYSGGLPQIVRAAGARWFLTQKISWNQINRMPHHTFWWEGIDGSRLFTHFPPVDTYNSTARRRELARAERNFSREGPRTMSIVPFGWGDGGGGPTREMIAAGPPHGRSRGLAAGPHRHARGVLRRGRGRVRASRRCGSARCTSSSTGAPTRRRSGPSRATAATSTLLREAELWAATAAVRDSAGVPLRGRSSECWRTVLLQQFHDILPGSSIAWVHREAEANYGRVLEKLDAIVTRSIAALAGEGDTELVVNSAPVALVTASRRSVVGRRRR